MDQQAFRQLVASNVGSSSSSSARSSTTAQSRKRDPTLVAASPASELKPRKVASSSTYIDRAAARRLAGSDHEHLNAGTRQPDNTDALVPVKGLDLSLLAENKAKLVEGFAGSGPDNDEAELEHAYEQSHHTHSSTRIEPETAEKDRLGENHGIAGSKLSRDEIIEALERRKRKSNATSSTSHTTNSGLGKGFKPIGAASAVDDENEAEYKWVNGKRMRRKRKTRPLSEPADVSAMKPVDPMKSSAEPSENRSQLKQTPQTSDGPKTRMIADRRESASPTRTVSPIIAPKSLLEDDEDEDEDEDIFAGVGGWTGLPEEDADEDDIELQQSGSAANTPEKVSEPLGSIPNPSPQTHIATTSTATLSQPPTPPAPTTREDSPLNIPTNQPESIKLPSEAAPPSHQETNVIQTSQQPPGKARRSKWQESDDEGQHAKKRKKKKASLK